MNRVSSKLAAKTGIRQVEAVLKADRAADAAERAVRAVWADVLRLLRSLAPYVHHHGVVHHAALRVFSRLRPETHAALAGRLRALAVWGQRGAADLLAETLPVPYLAAAAGREGRYGKSSAPVPEHFEWHSVRIAHSPGVGKYGIQEAAEQTGAVGLSLDGGALSASDLAAPLREPVAGALTDARKRELFQALLFPPPSEAEVEAVVHAPSAGLTWAERLRQATRLASPEALATVLTRGYAQGKTQREIAADLLPVVRGVQTSARRIARTEGLRIAHATQEAMFDQLGDLVIGFQTHATLDQNTRPWHAARSGTVYYKNPAPGQKGLAQMPHPPMEPEDPAERPPGTPETAHN